jgi:membrane fusion protein (multidrug efflux system)
VEVIMHVFQFVRLTLLFGTMATAFALLASCVKDSAGQPAGTAPSPTEIMAATVNRADIPLRMAYMGQTAGSREVEVRARVAGILLHRNYEEGRPVRQGDLMFEIDPAPYQAALEQAKGALGQAEAKLTQAQRDYARMEKLFHDDVVAKKDRDDAQTTLESAVAAVNAAQGKIHEAGLNLEWTKVTAPISGMTSKETRSEGSLVTTAAEGSLLTTISRVDPLYVNFSMAGAEMARFRKLCAEDRIAFSQDGDFVVRLNLPDGTEYAQPGRINFTDTQVDSTTGVVKVRAQFPNPKSELLPGQFVRVRLEGASLKGALIVPQHAVLTTQQGPMVWVIGKGDTVTPRALTLGDQIGDNYLVEGGLEDGERIVTEGINKVRPGMAVHVRAEAMAETPVQDAGKEPRS